MASLDSDSMNPLKRPRSTYRISLKMHTKEADTWGTDLGARVSAEINRTLVGLSEGTLVVFDYVGIRRSDASFQREAVVETIRRHHPRLLFIVEGVEDRDLRSNLVLALERRGNAVLLRGKSGRVDAVGAVTQPQIETLAAVSNLDEITSRELKKRLPELSASNATNRLNDLASAGLLERVNGSATGGGKQYHFYAIC